jgi:hypothetical protein
MNIYTFSPTTSPTAIHSVPPHHKQLYIQSNTTQTAIHSVPSHHKQLHIQSHNITNSYTFSPTTSQTAIHSVPPHHQQLIPQQNSGVYNPMYQLVYDQPVKPPQKPSGHSVKLSNTNKPVSPQHANSQQLQLHATHTKSC